MFKQIKYSSILKSKNIAGVEAVFLPEGGLHFNVTILKKSKSGLNVHAALTQIIGIEELIKVVDMNFPIHIVISGKGIIHKKVVLKDGEDENKLLDKILPNAKINDFYVQRTELSGDTVFASIARKNTIDGLLDAFINKGYYFSGISFGPFCINGIIPLLNLSKDHLLLGNYKLMIFNEWIEDFQENSEQFSSKKISIAGEELNQQAILAFASAFQYFFSFQGKTSFMVPLVKESREELVQKKLFQFTGISALVVFLTILFFNFFLFNYYGDQVQQMNAAFSGKKEQLEIVNELNTKVKEKQDFLEKTGLKGSSKTSFYADRIAFDLPETIQLTHLYLHPSEKKIKKDDPFVFLKNTIVVKGNCKKSTELNEWIRTIKQMKWVNDVSVINYKQENYKEPGEFEIIITIS
ncbi:MAG: hypothetical protein H0V01_04415 [Bacteroidetes bacterium]|nr:hypothetical protein [Bacteroidota bacterium]HET6243895.1 hypothetical protein [Bacteroidia bacterium]